MKSMVIKSDRDYEAVAKRMEELQVAPAGSNPAKELKSLTKAVIQYQRRNQPTADSGGKRYELKF